jgi:hypothetical protein
MPRVPFPSPPPNARHKVQSAALAAVILENSSAVARRASEQADLAAARALAAEGQAMLASDVEATADADAAREASLASSVALAVAALADAGDRAGADALATAAADLASAEWAASKAEAARRMKAEVSKANQRELAVALHHEQAELDAQLVLRANERARQVKNDERSERTTKRTNDDEDGPRRRRRRLRR